MKKAELRHAFQFIGNVDEAEEKAAIIKDSLYNAAQYLAQNPDIENLTIKFRQVGQDLEGEAGSLELTTKQINELKKANLSREEIKNGIYQELEHPDFLRVAHAPQSLKATAKSEQSSVPTTAPVSNNASQSVKEKDEYEYTPNKYQFSEYDVGWGEKPEKKFDPRAFSITTLIKAIPSYMKEHPVKASIIIDVTALAVGGIIAASIFTGGAAGAGAAAGIGVLIGTGVGKAALISLACAVGAIGTGVLAGDIYTSNEYRAQLQTDRVKTNSKEVKATEPERDKQRVNSKDVEKDLDKKQTKAKSQTWKDKVTRDQSEISR
ncbi:hypothetical protein RFI_19847 [Reticulomyxa filosa]|uniref:Uncharacterized protein n=1 Tax=Reticulomyxa filosa TaxID=46433 RepID=X6MU27_RETFI|nr:hypothetical protein RFI_19847 [Reticulomyxa filosa]|eukprot:ETO17473.1 hypothetical protein RFI_19847 [Reticulomyxa filosa]